MQTSILTTRIDTTILGTIRESAEQGNITQRKFIEDAVRYFTIEQKRKKIKESFKHIIQDQENQTLAHNGLEDLLSYY